MTAAEALLAPWNGPYGGVPPFDRVDVEAFREALLEAIARQRDEIAWIAYHPEAPTFENTIAALENVGRPLARVLTVFGTFARTMNVGPMRALRAEMSPILAASRDEIIQNAALFARVSAVNAAPREHLDAEACRLVDVIYREFATDGAALEAEQKTRLGAINGRLATLYTEFSQNELADEEAYALVFDDAADLAGLPESLVASAARTASEKGLTGRWAIVNTRSSMEPFLTYSSRRDLRERGWRMWVMRGDNGDANDNKAVITEIMHLRAEKAQLLGFATYAHYITSQNMAQTPDAALGLLMRVWPAAVARAREEIAEMQRAVDAAGESFALAPWDYRYYAEIVRKATHDLDQDAVKSYLRLENMRDAMFWAAGELYGLTFEPVNGVPVYHPSMSVYEVRRDGESRGLWYFDPYARDGKASGAWMNSYRPQERLAGDVAPIVSNNTNFIPGAAGTPVLISWSDATTLFHEFGHALHGLLSDVTFPTLAGTSVARDFVEFPSQINERWLITPDVLSRFARHVEHGEPMPPELIERIERARNFNQGFGTTEYLAAAIFDMKIHLAADGAAIDPAAFEADVMAEIGMPAEIVMRHRPTHFGHIFAGDGYSAGYYDYLWADTLTADAYEAFLEGDGPWDRAVATRLRDTILRVGNTVEAADAFRAFRGRDVDAAALMRDRGFPVEAT